MAVTGDDLRDQLGYTVEEWSLDDAARAETVIAAAVRRARSMVGGWRVDRAIEDEDGDKLDAVDEAVMLLAIARFENPESLMQRRAGADNSVSYADSSDAAGGRREAREILRGAFGVRAGTTTL